MGEYSTKKSAELFERARKSLPGGLGSIARGPVPGVLPHPLYFERGEGARVWDADGNEYIDYALAFGPMILGHRPRELMDHVHGTVAERGISFGICHDLEIEAAERVVRHVPSVDYVRFANSGSEAVMVAIRLARGFTGKEKIVRFEGNYHGWGDPIHWNVRSPLGAIGPRHNPRQVPGTAGIPEAYGQGLVIQPWNDLEILERTLKRRAYEIAAVITEPIMCNLGATMPKEGFLKGLRELCDRHDVLLIFDEVITGFRLGLSGAQGYYGVMPDITTMAKALGGGYPVSAFGARREIMEMMSHAVITNAGTYNQNVMAMAAVCKTVDILERPGTYEKLHALGDRLRQGLERVIHEAGMPAVAQGAGPILQIWFEDRPVVDYRDGMTRRSLGLHPLFTRAMYRRGVHFNPSITGVWYISTAHTERDIHLTLEAAADAISEVKSQL